MIADDLASSMKFGNTTILGYQLRTCKGRQQSSVKQVSTAPYLMLHASRVYTQGCLPKLARLFVGACKTCQGIPPQSTMEDGEAAAAVHMPIG
jgi:hypothetical protein